MGLYIRLSLYDVSNSVVGDLQVNNVGQIWGLPLLQHGISSGLGVELRQPQ